MQHSCAVVSNTHHAVQVLTINVQHAQHSIRIPPCTAETHGHSVYGNCIENFEPKLLRHLSAGLGPLISTITWLLSLEYLCLVSKDAVLEAVELGGSFSGGTLHLFSHKVQLPIGL